VAGVGISEVVHFMQISSYFAVFRWKAQLSFLVLNALSQNACVVR
jgi:hypothetical protein